MASRQFLHRRGPEKVPRSAPPILVSEEKGNFVCGNVADECRKNEQRCGSHHEYFNSVKSQFSFHQPHSPQEGSKNTF
jgi:hypothetical protein